MDEEKLYKEYLKSVFYPVNETYFYNVNTRELIPDHLALDDIFNYDFKKIDFSKSFLFGEFFLRALLISFILAITSKRRGLPGIPIALSDGETARQIVFSVLELSATTRFVVIASSPRSIHSTEA